MRTFISLAGLALLASCASEGRPSSPTAVLDVSTKHGDYRVEIRRDPEVGYLTRFDCVATCPVTGLDAFAPGTPLGLFQLEPERLLVALFASGSAYHLQVWSFDESGVRGVLETASRSFPEFSRGDDGDLLIVTGEADGGTQPVTDVGFRYDGEQFQRLPLSE